MLSIRSLLITLLLATPALQGVAEESSEDPKLTIGTTAPALDVEHWFTAEEQGVEQEEGEAKEAEPITDFESDKVYVVEFWATWCGPCIMSIPHITELQKEYRDQGVTVVSLSDEDVETIEPFFEREVMQYEGDAEETPTYGDLMSVYRVGTDPDGSVSEDYMKAASQNGIPCAFLVGKTGKIEWIGHPMELDEPLAAVVDGSWDREAFAEEFKRKQKVDQIMQEAMVAMRQGDVEGLREKANELKDLSDDPQTQMRAKLMLSAADQIESQLIIRTEPDRAVAELKKMIKRLDGNAEQINRVTWGIYQMSQSEIEVRDDLLQAAADATEKAMTEGEPNASLLDTVGHLYYELGKVEKAIDYQQKAVEAAKTEGDPEMQKAIEEFLQVLIDEQSDEKDKAEEKDEPAPKS